MAVGFSLYSTSLSPRAVAEPGPVRPLVLPHGSVLLLWRAGSHRRPCQLFRLPRFDRLCHRPRRVLRRVSRPSLVLPWKRLHDPEQRVWTGSSLARRRGLGASASPSALDRAQGKSEAAGEAPPSGMAGCPRHSLRVRRTGWPFVVAIRFRIGHWHWSAALMGGVLGALIGLARPSPTQFPCACRRSSFARTTFGFAAPKCFRSDTTGFAATRSSRRSSPKRLIVC